MRCLGERRDAAGCPCAAATAVPRRPSTSAGCEPERGTDHRRSTTRTGLGERQPFVPIVLDTVDGNWSFPGNDELEHRPLHVLHKERLRRSTQSGLFPELACSTVGDVFAGKTSSCGWRPRPVTLKVRAAVRPVHHQIPPPVWRLAYNDDRRSAGRFPTHRFRHRSVQSCAGRAASHASCLRSQLVGSGWHDRPAR